MIREEIKDNIGIIYLDRPEKLNALNEAFINKLREILNRWKKNSDIKAILLDSKADKGFSAGGDIKEIYTDYLINDDCKEKDKFFVNEFDLDKYIANYKKPIISHWYGVTMGGGIGLTINTDFIITDESINWAMPETDIGFTPDVGMCHYLAKLPRSIGQYIGLTGSSLSASDLVRYSLADLYIKSDDYKKVINHLFDLSTKYSGDELIDEFKKKVSQYETRLQQTDLDIEKINKYFSHDSFKEIIDDLKSNLDDEFAKKSYQLLKERDQFVLTLQFEKYFVCKDLSYEETLDLDLRLLNHAIKTGSMSEGIRAKLIDKDNNPNWPIKSIDDVSIDEIKNLLKIDKTHKEKINN